MSVAKSYIINGFIRSLDPTEGIQGAMVSDTYEPAQSDWVRSILQTGARFVDVGASFGYYTSLASRIVGPTGRVFAFEPSPVAYKSLVEMISDNQIENIEVYHAAAGDRDGKVDILLPPNGELHSPSIFDCGEGFTPHSVPLVRLDSHLALADGVLIDLIKIDVEGFEPNVIEGLRGLISRGLVRMIMLEFNSGWLRRNGSMTPERLLEIILGLGYAVVARTEKGVGIERDGVTPYELQDILFRLENWKNAEKNDV